MRFFSFILVFGLGLSGFASSADRSLFETMYTARTRDCHNEEFEGIRYALVDQGFRIEESEPNLARLLKQALAGSDGIECLYLEKESALSAADHNIERYQIVVKNRMRYNLEFHFERGHVSSMVISRGR